MRAKFEQKDTNDFFYYHDLELNVEAKEWCNTGTLAPN